MGGRPQGSPLRKRYKGCGEAAGWGQPTLRGGIRGAVKRADVGIGPYGGYKEYGARPGGGSILPCEKLCQVGLNILFVSELLNVASFVAGEYMLEYLR